MFTRTDLFAKIGPKMVDFNRVDFLWLFINMLFMTVVD